MTVHLYQKFLDNYSDKLHPNHWILTQTRLLVLNNETFDKGNLETIEFILEQCRCNNFEYLKPVVSLMYFFQNIDIIV